jgi:hypothetical protein
MKDFIAHIQKLAVNLTTIRSLVSQAQNLVQTSGFFPKYDFRGFMCRPWIQPAPHLAAIFQLPSATWQTGRTQTTLRSFNWLFN